MRSAHLAAFSLVIVLCSPAQAQSQAAQRPPARPTESVLATTSIEGVQGLIRAGRYAEAERQARALLHQNEQIYGAESMQTAEVLDILAEAMRNAGRTGAPDAEAICQRAITLKKKLAGRNSAAYAASVHNLGALYMVNGDFSRAKPLLQEALEIREQTLGANDPEVARSLLFLANLYDQMHRESDAIPLVERAAQIQKTALPESDPERMRAVNMLAGFRYRMGDYVTPAHLWEEVLASRSKALGADHPLVAEALHNLGALAAESGDYDQALIYLEQALKIRRARLRRNHPYIASTLVVIADALRSSGDVAGARARYEEALRIQEHEGNRNPIDLAWTLQWLGGLLLEQGDFAQGKRYLNRARALCERALGPENPEEGWTLNSLAAVAEHEGNHAEAKALYEQSLRIKETAYGASYPDVVKTQGEYARFLASTGDTTRAFDLALRAARARVEHLRSTARGLSERQALAYAGTGSLPLDVVLRLAASHCDTSRVAAAWDVLVRSRMVVLDEIAARHGAAAESQDSSVAAPRRELEEARRRYANLLVRGIGVDNPGRYRSVIDRAREDVEGAERDLAARSGRFQAEQRQDEVGWSEVARAIPDGWALAAFSLTGSGARRSYVAFVAERGREPTAVLIGSASRVDALAMRFAGAMARGDRTSRGRDLSLELRCRAVGDSLRKLVWDPIQSWIGSAGRLFIIPDGTLHLVNFAALPTDGGRYLVETGPLIHYLSAERDLVRIPHRREGVGLLALGGAAFDSLESPVSMARPLQSSNVAGGGGASRGIPASRSAVRGPQPECHEFRDTRFPPLPESASEVREIVSEWGSDSETITLTGTQAGEAALKALAPGRRVLHLATHGFFLDATRCTFERPGARGIGGVATTRPSRPAARPERSSPLLISGLALTGANRRLSARPDQEDGVLMAQEAVSMDLSRTEWVVLSACDTGLGKVQAGEGVLGLRRAFEAAGAGAVIMSLWEVEDRAAREWMRRLYEARFHEGRSTPQAVRDATLGVLRDRRARGLGTHPFYWAGFVAAGDWR